MSLAAVFLGAALLVPAHQTGLSRGVYTAATPGVVEAELTLARADLAVIVPAVADALAGAIERQPLPLASLAGFADLIVARAGDEPCAVAPFAAEVVERDGITIALRVTCEGTGGISIDHRWIERASPGHRHIARVIDQDVERAALLLAGETSLVVASPRPPGRAAFIGIGVEHILFGVDHLVFLFALVLVGGRRASVLALVTAFTIAHSLTLALAVLDVAAPPASVIEPLIAVSIVWVGLENLFITDIKTRWRLAGVFGLVHGFGFAGALADVGLPADDVPVTLLAFNIGVELGQLAFLAVLVPPLELARRRGWLQRRFTVGASLAVSAAGLAWFIARVVG